MKQDLLNVLIHPVRSTRNNPSLLLPISSPSPTLHIPPALKSGLYESVAWQSVYAFAYFVRGCVSALRLCRYMCECVKSTVSRSLAFVILSAATLSFIRARPAAHRLSVYGFTVLGPCLLQHVGGWFLTHGNLGSPRFAGTIEDLSVSGHWKRARRQAMMSESFTPTYTSSILLGSRR